MDSSMNFCLDTLREIYGDTNKVLNLLELNEFELTVVLVTRVLGIGVNMGLSEMLEQEIDGDPGYHKSMASFQRISSPEVATLISELRLLVQDTDKENSASRKMELDEQFYRLESKLFDRLARYIKAKKSKGSTHFE